jgi:hypothetical protein
MTKEHLEAIRRRDGVEYTASVSQWAHDAKVDRLRAENERLKSVIELAKAIRLDRDFHADCYCEIVGVTEFQLALAALEQKP